MRNQEYLNLLPKPCHKFVEEVLLYGSRYVGGAAVTPESDTDILVLAPKGLAEILAITLRDQGFSSDMTEIYDGSGFHSFRKGDLNVILVLDRDWFVRAQTAMEVCRVLQLTNKEHRILVHDVLVRHRSFTQSSGWEAENTDDFSGGLFE